MTECFSCERTLLLLRGIDRRRTYMHTFGLPELPLLLIRLPLSLPLSHSLSSISKNTLPCPVYAPKLLAILSFIIILCLRKPVSPQFSRLCNRRKQVSPFKRTPHILHHQDLHLPLRFHCCRPNMRQEYTVLVVD